MFTLALTVLLSASPTTPPVKPDKIEWGGGKWTGEDEDKGKEFPKGAFLYTPKAEYAKYVKTAHEWLINNPKEINYQSYSIRETLAGLKFTGIQDEPQVVANGPLKAYGGAGVIVATRICPDNDLQVSIALKGVDFEQMSDGLAMSIPIRVTGTVGSLTGTIKNNRGTFVGTDVRSSGVRINRLDLSVNYSNGQYVATADTSYGAKTIRGRLREAK